MRKVCSFSSAKLLRMGQRQNSTVAPCSICPATNRTAPATWPAHGAGVLRGKGPLKRLFSVQRETNEVALVVVGKSLRRGYLSAEDARGMHFSQSWALTGGASLEISAQPFGVSRVTPLMSGA